jgi:Flp pilus assembly protein TadG
MSRRRIRGERGQALVEFVLVLPILLMLVFAVVQFGITYHHYITVTDATRAGARAAVVNTDEDDPEAVAETAVRDSAVNLDQSELDVNVSFTGYERGDEVTVEAVYPYEINLLGIVVASGNLTSETTEAVE